MAIEPEEHIFRDEEPSDMYEDMAKLNMLYEELCGDNDDILQFCIEGDRIVIRNKTLEEEV